MPKDKRIKPYISKDEVRYMFQIYAGVNPVTKKKHMTTRRGFKSEQEAYIALRRLEIEIEEKGFNTQAQDTYLDLYNLWLVDYQTKVKESTFAKTKGLFKNHILPAFGHLKIESISPLYCQSVLNDWSTHLKKCSMVMNYAGLVFEFAMKLELIDKNPTKLVTAPKKEVSFSDRKSLNFYDKEMLQQFLIAAEEEYGDTNYKVYALFRTLAFTGMRKGEVLALQWSDINWKEKTLLVNKTLTTGEGSRLIIQTPKTVNSIREIILDDTTIAILKNWKKKQKEEYFMLGINTSGKNQLVFSNTKNEYLSLSKPRKWLIHLQNKYNLKKITIHGFRHTLCSLLFESGASIKEVQDRLGHSDIQTTMNIYTHITEKAQDDTAKRFANYVGF